MRIQPKPQSIYFITIKHTLTHFIIFTGLLLYNLQNNILIHIINNIKINLIIKLKIIFIINTKLKIKIILKINTKIIPQLKITPTTKNSIFWIKNKIFNLPAKGKFCRAAPQLSFSFLLFLCFCSSLYTDLSESEVNISPN